MTARSAPAAAFPARRSTPKPPTPSTHIILLVYLTPVVLFMAGYLVTAFLTDSVAAQYTAAATGFLVGIVGAIAYDRRLKRQGGLTFRIVRLF